MTGTALLGTLASTASITGSWPQAWRLRRIGTATGVPAAGALLGVLSCVSWGGYGVLRSDPSQITTNVLCLVPAVLVLTLVARHARPRALPLVTAVLLWAAGMLAADLLAGAVAVGAACTAMGLAQRTPQVREVFVARSLRGLSPVACLLATTGSVLWLSYGVARCDGAVVVSSLLGVALNGLVLSRRVPAHRLVAVAADLPVPSFVPLVAGRTATRGPLTRRAPGHGPARLSQRRAASPAAERRPRVGSHVHRHPRVPRRGHQAEHR